MALRRWNAEGQRLEISREASQPNRGVGCAEQGLALARIQVRWFDNLLRVHAGRRTRERSHDGLFSLSRAGRAVLMIERLCSADEPPRVEPRSVVDRKSTRLN